MEENKKRPIPETKVYKNEEQPEEKAALVSKTGKIIRETKGKIREVLGMQNPENSLNVENMSKEDLLKEVAEKREGGSEKNPLGISEDLQKKFDRLIALLEQGESGNAVRENEGKDLIMKFADTPEFLAYRHLKEESKAIKEFTESMNNLDIPEDEAEKIVEHLRKQFSSPLKRTLEEYQKAVETFFAQVALKGFTRLKFGEMIPYEKENCILLSRGGSMLVLEKRPEVEVKFISYMPLPNRKDGRKPWGARGRVLDQKLIKEYPNIKKDVGNNGKIGETFYYMTNGKRGNISAVEFAASKEVIADGDIKFIEKTFQDSMDGLSELLKPHLSPKSEVHERQA